MSAPGSNAAPPSTLYALAGLAMVAHSAAVLLVLIGAVVFTIAFGFVIMIVTLGMVRSIFLEGVALIWPPKEFFWLLVALLSVKPVTLVLTVLALRSVRWAQVALCVAVGLLVIADVGVAIDLLVDSTKAASPMGPLVLVLAAGAQLFLLWQLEGKRRFGHAS